MAYLRKRYKEILERIDKELKLPRDWEFFVKKEAEKDNLIIKTNGVCICGNCKTEFKSNKKINEIDQCPKCKNYYLIKRNNCKWYDFEPRTLVLLDRLDNNWVIRLFELQSRYYNKKIYHSEAVEYGRRILFDDLNFVNNRVYCSMYGTESVRVYEKMRTWRLYHSGYQKLYACGKLFDKNLKKLFKDTEYKYSQLWTLAKKEDDIDIVYYLRNNLPSTELLIKMGLYKLALCPVTFNKKGGFQQRFGIDKEYYKFMKKYNIDIDELNVLRLYKKKDINKIRYLKQFRLEHLTKVAKYMSLDDFIEFLQSKDYFDMDLYIDYIGFLEDLDLDLKNKEYLFPEDIKAEHDKYQIQVEIKNDEITKEKIKKRYEELNKNTFFNKIFIIKPAKSIEDLEDESKQQKNCVRTYAERYSKGECDIYFMREIDRPDKSLVTVEVQDNKVVQSRIKHNNAVNKTQKQFLDIWQETILNAA